MRAIRAMAVVSGVILLVAGAWGQEPLRVKKLRCEYKSNPMGIDVAKPRFSWELESTEKNTLQTGYEVQVSLSEKELAKEKVIWESGEVKSDASVGVEYGGAPLVSGRIYYWHVKVWDNHGHVTGWSEPAKWEMGLLTSADWKAKWIIPDVPEDEAKSNPAPILRKEFALNGKKQVERARIYASAMGLYELKMNGKRVGQQYFTPGWTAYDFRIQYQTFDASGLLTSGKELSWSDAGRRMVSRAHGV